MWKGAFTSSRLLSRTFRPTRLVSYLICNYNETRVVFADTLSLCAIEGCDPSNIAFHTSDELKSNLIEGAATLYVIDEDKSKHAMQLARSLSSVPELVKSQLEELRKHLAVEARVSTPSIWSLALLPIFDHSSVLKEMKLITRIMHALADTTLDKVSNGFSFLSLVLEFLTHLPYYADKTRRYS